MDQPYCEPCGTAILHGNFCCFCNQPYSSEDDGCDWVLCECCEKWVHVDCAAPLLPALQRPLPLGDYICPPCKGLPMKRKILKDRERPAKRRRAEATLSGRTALAADTIKNDIQYLRGL